MEESRDSREDPSPPIESPFQRTERRTSKPFRAPPEIKYNRSNPFPNYASEKPEYNPDYYVKYRTDQKAEEYEKHRTEYAKHRQYDRHSPGRHSPAERSPRQKENINQRAYPPFPGRQFRSNSISGVSLLSLGQEEREKYEQMRILKSKEPPYNTLPMSSLRFFRKEEQETESEDESRSKGRKKIKMEFIKDKGRRGVTFSKRKKGIMKKAYELNVLTKCEILLVVASETGHVYTFATPKLQPIIKQHENLIQQYLNTPYMNEVNRIYDTSERYSIDPYYKGADGYGYDRILRHEYPPNYYNSGYDTDSSPGNNGSRLG